MVSEMTSKAPLPYGSGSGEGKKEQVRKMFNHIAHRYDLLNRILTLGIDLRWRSQVARRVRKLQPQRILDAATGTADMIISLKKVLPDVCIVGVDIAEEMLALAREKLASYRFSNVYLQCADVEALPFSSQTFDVITVTFGVRNFENLEKGLLELKRVLKDDGKIFILEPGIPKNPLVRYPFLLYFRHLLPLIGGAISKDWNAYHYLFNSVQWFPQREEFCYLCRQIGFRQTHFFPLTLGTCLLYELGK